MPDNMPHDGALLKYMREMDTESSVPRYVPRWIGSMSLKNYIHIKFLLYSVFSINSKIWRSTTSLEVGMYVYKPHAT